MLVIAVPVLRRPHRVAPLIESIEAATPEDHRTLFIASPEDDEEIAALKAADADWIETPGLRKHGDYARKINLAYMATWEPLLFLAADDIRPHPGWLPKALDCLTEGVGVVGTNDLTNKRTRKHHSTHSLVTREYADRGTIDEPHKILHEGYRHQFCDDELVATAESRGAYVHADDCYVEHLHPMRQKSPLDSTYELGLSSFERDRRVFQGRQHLWH